MPMRQTRKVQSHASAMPRPMSMHGRSSGLPCKATAFVCSSSLSSRLAPLRWRILHRAVLDMPVDFVKIDSSLVTDPVKDSRCATKVKIISRLASSMGAWSIAECVEDAETREAWVTCSGNFGPVIA